MKHIIDAQPILDELSKSKAWLVENMKKMNAVEFSGHMAAVCTAEDLILREPEILPENVWISVKDRLPDMHEEVIVDAVDCSRDVILVSDPVLVWPQPKNCLATFIQDSDGPGWWDACACEQLEVTHWMPLPSAPPEGGGADG